MWSFQHGKSNSQAAARQARAPMTKRDLATILRRLYCTCTFPLFYRSLPRFFLWRWSSGSLSHASWKQRRFVTSPQVGRQSCRASWTCQNHPGWSGRHSSTSRTTPSSRCIAHWRAWASPVVHLTGCWDRVDLGSWWRLRMFKMASCTCTLRGLYTRRASESSVQPLPSPHLLRFLLGWHLIATLQRHSTLTTNCWLFQSRVCEHSELLPFRFQIISSREVKVFDFPPFEFQSPSAFIRLLFMLRLLFLAPRCCLWFQLQELCSHNNPY